MNVKELLRDCINYIYQFSDNFIIEIIVVDNYSNDGSVEMLRDEFPDIILIQNEQNIGFARANNQGIQIAKGKYIFFLNPDTCITKNFFVTLVNEFDKCKNIGIIGPRILNNDGSIQFSCARLFPKLSSTLFLDTFRLNKIPFLEDYFNKKFNSPYDYYKSQIVESISGAAIIARSELVNILEGFGDDYLHGGEDLDFCYRIRKQGYLVYYCHDSIMYHYGGKSSKNNKLQTQLNYYLSQYIFFMNCYGKFYALLYKEIIQIVKLPVDTFIFFLKAIFQRNDNVNLNQWLLFMYRILKWSKE